MNKSRIEGDADQGSYCGITATGHPAIAVPCGFTANGLPVGLQIVGRHQSEFALLQIVHAFEQATHIGRRPPPLAIQG